MKKDRYINLDYLRAYALFLVILAHNVFEMEDIITWGDKLMLTIRMTCMSAIALWLILSGYLCNRRPLGAKHYLSYIHIFVQFMLCSILCEIFNILYLGYDASPVEILRTFTTFSASKYAWYVVLYNGLFLLMPFLNIVYHGLKTKKQKQFLLLTMIFLTILPSFANLYFHIYEQWWYRLYPLTYYFIGAYLSEFMPKIKPWKLFIALLASIIAYAAFIMYYCNFKILGTDDLIYHDSFGIFIIALITFVLFCNLNLSGVPTVINKVVTQISKVSFSAYLLSHIFDSILYQKYFYWLPYLRYRYKYSPRVVLMSYIGSILLACVVEYISERISKWLKTRIEKRIKKEA